jgi:hypothetical protein
MPAAWALAARGRSGRDLEGRTGGALDERLCRFASQDRLVGVSGSDGRGELGNTDMFEQVAGRAGLQRPLSDKLVNATTQILGHFSRSLRVVATPSMPGMIISISTTSGCSRSQTPFASSPLAASRTSNRSRTTRRNVAKSTPHNLIVIHNNDSNAFELDCVTLCVCHFAAKCTVRTNNSTLATWIGV